MSLTAKRYTSAELAEVTAIAEQSRLWAERSNKRRKKRFDSDLGGMCGIASGHLLRELHRGGFTDAVAVSNDNHCFIVWRGLVVDITATQFKYDRVYITPHTAQMRLSMWKIQSILKSPLEIRNYQIKERWPPGQIVPARLVDYSA